MTCRFVADPQHQCHTSFGAPLNDGQECFAETSAQVHGELVCPMCGPFRRPQGDVVGACPTCAMTRGEHAYRARILADSTAVYAEEARAYRAARARGEVA